LNRDAFLREVASDGTLRAESALVRAFTPSHGALAHYLVFSQRKTSRLDIGGWRSRARSFFGADIGLAVDKTNPTPPDVDAALVMIHHGDASGTRVVLARPASDDDVALARSYEGDAHGAGMSLLAERCGRVWLIASEGRDDRASLLIAAICASHELGPIVDRERREVYGVRTARTHLEALGGAYR